MTTAEERLKILTMIQEGKISAEDGIALLEVMGSTEKAAGTKPGSVKRGAAPVQAAQPTTPSGEGRWFRVMVTDMRTGKTRVNLRMPVSMVSAGMKLGARFAPQVQGLEAKSLIDMLNAGMVGKIVDVYDDDDSEHVQVFIE